MNESNPTVRYPNYSEPEIVLEPWQEGPRRLETEAESTSEPPAGEPPPVIEPEPDPTSIRVSRTLVKSEPELAELVAAHSQLHGDLIEVELAEKGFGTRVAISTPVEGGLAQAELETLLDELAEPQKRPFTNT